MEFHQKWQGLGRGRGQTELKKSGKICQSILTIFVKFEGCKLTPDLCFHLPKKQNMQACLGRPHTLLIGPGIGVELPLICLVGCMPLHVVLVGAPHQVPGGQTHLFLTLMAGLQVGAARGAPVHVAQQLVEGP